MEAHLGVHKSLIHHFCFYVFFGFSHNVHWALRGSVPTVSILGGWGWHSMASDDQHSKILKYHTCLIQLFQPVTKGRSDCRRRNAKSEFNSHCLLGDHLWRPATKCIFTFYRHLVFQDMYTNICRLLVLHTLINTWNL